MKLLTTPVTRVSPFTGKTHTIEIPLDPVVFAECLVEWEAGAMIQDAFSMLSADDREYIKTGITPQKWKSTFGE